MAVNSFVMDAIGNLVSVVTSSPVCRFASPAAPLHTVPSGNTTAACAPGNPSSASAPSRVTCSRTAKSSLSPNGAPLADPPNAQTTHSTAAADGSSRCLRTKLIAVLA